MTSNLVECFNNVLKGARALPVTAIVEYTFFKLNEYFQRHSEETAKWIGEKRIIRKRLLNGCSYKQASLHGNKLSYSTELK